MFHYSFATEVLDPFRGMTAQQFNAISLFQQNQKAILGTVILPPAVVWPTEPQFREYGIQFVRQEPFTPGRDPGPVPPRQVQDRSAGGCRGVLLPDVRAAGRGGGPSGLVRSRRASPWVRPARWAKGNTCYSQGWAFGPVKFFPGDRIASAYHSGDLKPSDILLTDGVPAEVPFVAGIISLVPSTPNSHVAILARTYAVPFVHLVLAEDAQRAQELVGRRILLTAYDKQDGTNEVKLIDMDRPRGRRHGGADPAAQAADSAEYRADGVPRGLWRIHGRAVARRRPLRGRQGIQLQHPASGRAGELSQGRWP